MIYYIGLIVLGLIFGSFYNVVIHRAPQFLEQQTKPSTPTLSLWRQLSWPASYCPHCQKSLAWFDNIPILSWLILMGRCRLCQQPIKLRYLLVEGITAFIFVTSYWHYGPTFETALWIFFFSVLTLLFFIDLETFLLPDFLTFPLLLVGLFAAAIHFNTLQFYDAVAGALFGFFVLYIINLLYKIWRKVEGFGDGDLKLVAGLGAWLGWKAILPILMLSSGIALLFVLILSLLGRKFSPTTMIPFGPSLILAGLIMYAQPMLFNYY